MICFFPERQIQHWHYYTQVIVFMLTFIGFYSSYNYEFTRFVEEWPELSMFRSLMIEMSWIRAIPYIAVLFLMFYVLISLV